VRVEPEPVLTLALALARQRQWPLLVLGGGSNLVLSGDFPGLCLQVALRGISHEILDSQWVCVTAAAGENWHEFVALCLRQGWHGLENLALIPGTVGASPIQNIGAYGVEMGDFLSHLEAIDRQTGERRRFSVRECRLGYRDSLFKRQARDRYVITSVSFRLRRQPKPNLTYRVLAEALAGEGAPTPRALFDAVIAIRQQKLPDPRALPNAGSFFKNPVVSLEHYQSLKARFPALSAYPDSGGMKLAAGWLIDQAGWKGVGEGGAAVHDAQALVLVNRGGATGADVRRIAAAIGDDVFARFGVRLEPEPVFVRAGR
jgi:UDP-N-acetylmuramate dehydrogenase